MANGNIDDLNIRLSADAERAEKSLNSFINTLKKLNTSFRDINSTNISGFSNSVRQLSTSLNEIKNVGNLNLSNIARELKKIEKIDYSKIGNAATPLKSYSESLRSLQGVGNVSIPEIDESSIKNISNVVKSFGKINPENMPQIANGLKQIAESMVMISGIKLENNNIKNLINALKRLIETDLTKFNVDSFNQIITVLSGLSNLPDVSANISRFVTSLAKLANAGANVGIVARNLPALSAALKKVVSDFSTVQNISKSTNDFVASISRLANAGGKTSQTAAGLDALAKKTLDFFKTMQNAPRISSNTLRMTQALAQLASAGSRVRTATNGLSAQFSTLSNTAKRAGSVITSAAKKIVSGIKSIGSSSSGIKSTNFSLKNLLSTLIAFQGIRSFWDFGKSSVELGSNIVEVENVVDVAFGSMADKAYEFAETATEQFGLSELAAKQYAGTMMSMLNSSGVAREEAAEMSTTLAGLAGDLASFYNIDTDTAFQKLRAGMAGEVMPLRQLGIDMTVASLEAYALANGITKSYSAMSQAEKQMLRYNYILSVTGAQQGDFARTSGTWANQVRLLKLNFDMLKASIGQGLISAILPVIQALNLLMAKLQQAAEYFRKFMEFLTGVKVTGGQSGVINDTSMSLDTMGDAGETAAGGLDSAASSADDLKKSLSVLPFDELNQLSSDLSDASSGGGGGISGGSVGNLGADIDFGDSDLEKAGETFYSRLADALKKQHWWEAGEIIGEGLNEGLQKIDDFIKWDTIGDKISQGITGITTLFNSIVYHFDWELLGKTVGDGVNTIVNSLNQLIEGINWKYLGKSFADGIMGLVDTVNWTNLGKLIGNKFMISWNILYGFVKNINFSKIGLSIANGLNGAIEKIDIGTIGESIGTLISGIFEIFKTFAQNANWGELGKEIANGINGFFSSFSFGDLSSTISAWVNGIFKMLFNAVISIDWGQAFNSIVDSLFNLNLGTAFLVAIPSIKAFWKSLKSGKISSFVKNFKKVTNAVSLLTQSFSGNQSATLLLTRSYPKLSNAVTKILSGFTKFKNLFKGNFFGNLDSAITGIRNKMSGLQKGVVGAVSVFAEFSLVNDAFYDLTSGSENVVASIAKIGVGAGAASAALYTAFGPAGIAIGAVTGLIAAFTGIDKAMDDIVKNSMFETLKTTGTVTLQELGETATDAFGKITSGVDQSIEKLNNIQTTRESIDGTVQSIDSIRLAVDNGAYSVSEKVPEIIDQFQSLLNESRQIFDDEYDVIVGNVVGAWADILEAQGQSVPEVVAQLASLRDQGTTAYSDIESSIQDLIQQYQNGTISAEDFYEQSKPLFDQLKSFNDDGTVDEATQSIKDLGESLDLSQYITDNSFDASVFQTYMDTVVQTASEGQENLKTIGEENNKTIEEYKNQLENLGIDTSSIDWAALYGASDQQVTDGVTNINNAYQTFADQIQEALVNQIPSLIDEATKDYEELDWWKKIFTTKDEYIQDTLNTWKENVVTPISDSINDSFIQLGIDGSEWASTASEEIISGLFTPLENVPAQFVDNATGSLKSNYQSIVEGALSGISEITKQRGKDTVDGWNSGVEENIGSSEDKAKEWQESIKDAVHNSVMEYGSPSKKMKEYGNDAVKGFNIGIEDSSKTTVPIIQKWLKSTSDAMSSFVKQFSDLGRQAAQKFSDGFTSIDIPTPHIYISGWDKHGLGNGKSMQTPRFDIDWYASGGLFTGATIAGIGEAGKEAVLPLENPRTMRMIADSILGNTSAGLTPDELRQAINEGMSIAMMNNSQNQPPINVYATLYTENNEVLARAVTQGQMSIDYRKNPTPKFDY